MPRRRPRRRSPRASPAPRRLHRARSRYGHDAFLKEDDADRRDPAHRLDARGEPRMTATAARHRAPCAPASTATPRTARSCRRSCCRRNFSFDGFGEKRALRLHAQRQSDARPARRGARRARRRRRRRRHRDRHGGGRAGAPALLEPGDRCSCRTTATAAAGACSTRWRAKGRFELDRSPTSTDPRALAAALARKPRAGLDRDAVQPAAAHHRPARVIAGRARAPARWSSSTTPSCRRRCSSRSRSAPTSSCIRRPSTSTATATSSAAR